MRYRLLLTLVLTLLGCAIMSAATVSGVVKDESGETLPQATVRLLSAADSSYVKGVSTNMRGVYTLTDVKRGKYIISVSYIGYADQHRNITVGDSPVNVPDIVMSESGILLKEATVVGVKTPITVKEDTIEYNADTYKVQPNAVVEDVLKRLPGVDVDAQGKITANGKQVTKILVDGKEFFSDDPKVASKNLPANMVDKIQVVDQKSELARLTGVDDGEDETVINLTVKKGMQNGWFGTVEAGYGTDKRYQGNFNINRFFNGNQITFIGGANNTNDLGFTDGNGNRFRRFGGDQGINTSQSFGVNFNVGKGEIFRVGGNVLYSHTDRDTRKQQNRQYLFPDSVSYTNSGSDARDKGHNVRADFRLQWKPNQYNTLDFRPNFSFNHNESNSIDSMLTLAGTMRPVNRSFTTDDSHGNSWEFGGNLIFNHNFANHPGRSFSVNARYNFSNVREYSDSYSHNLFYLFNDSIDAYYQYIDNHTWSNQAQGRLTWTEPIGDSANGNFLNFSYQMSYRWNNADRLTYDRNVTLPDDNPLGTPWIDPQMVFVDSLSNSFRNDFFNQDIRVGYKRVKKTYTLDVGMSLVPSMSESRDMINSLRDIPQRWVWNYAPYLRYRYKMGKSRSLSLSYQGRSSQPSMKQLQPVPDYSNPLRVVIGNPDLKPTFTHRANVRFQDYNADYQRSIMLMFNASMTQNSIVNRTTFNPETGGQVTTYANVNGAWNARLMNMISQPLRNKAWTVSNNMFIMADGAVGYNNGLLNRSTSLRVNESPVIAWRPTNVELELRSNYSLQTTHNSVATMATPTIHSYGGTFNGTYYTPFGLVLATDVTYTATEGYARGYNVNEWMWNGTISYQFLPGKAATVALKVYDLLHQKSNISRSVTANYIDDTRYNSLTRYFMLTFTYRFNSFGKGNEPQSMTGPRFGGPDGPGGSGERPSGPPPGAPAGPPPGGGPM